MSDKYTVTVERDAEECMDVRNASAYSGISSMQIRQYIRTGKLLATKRLALNNPNGRPKLWIHVTDLDMLLQKRAERLADRQVSVKVNGSICYRAQKIKSVRAMVQDYEWDPHKREITIDVLTEMLNEALDTCKAKQEQKDG